MPSSNSDTIAAPAPRDGRTAPSIACPMCRSGRVGPYCRKDDAQYYTCRDCRGLFQHPVADHAAMRGYADAEYDGGLYQDYVDARAMKLAHFRARMDVMRPHVRKGQLLDVGCACGYLLEVALAEGFEVQGLEFSPNAVAAARPDIRPRIMQASIDALSGEHDARYDVITAFDIIEHLEKPSEFLTQAKRLLRPGGHLIISTPDADHWLRPLMASRWPMLQPMQHLAIYSRRSLQLALENAGFQNVTVQTAHKVLTFEYLVDQLRSLNPLLYSILRTTTRAVPRGVMRMSRHVNIGEALAIARKSD